MLSPLVRRSLAPRGETPILVAPVTRDKVSVASALVLSPKRHDPQLLFHTLPQSNFNGEQSADFLRQLLTHIPGRLIVVWDGLPAHRAPAIRELLSRTRRLTLETFPPYAPELNPVEYLWRYLKHTLLVNLTLANTDDLDKVITHNLSELSQDKHRLRGYLRASPLPFNNPAFLS